MSASVPIIGGGWPRGSHLEILRYQLLPPDASCELAVCSTQQDTVALIQRVSAAQPDVCGLAILPIAGDSNLARFVGWLRVLRQLRSAERVAECAGLRVDARLGLFPTVDSPAIVFELQGAAGHYAETELLPEPVRGTMAFVKGVLRRVGGIPPSIGGVVMVLRKS